MIGLRMVALFSKTRFSYLLIGIVLPIFVKVEFKGFVELLIHELRGIFLKISVVFFEHESCATYLHRSQHNIYYFL